MSLPAAPPPRRLTAADFDPEVLQLFDQYVHGQIDRRGFLDRASRLAAARLAWQRTVAHFRATLNG